MSVGADDKVMVALRRLAVRAGVLAAVCALGGVVVGGSAAISLAGATLVWMSSGGMGLVVVALVPWVLIAAVVTVRSVVVLARLRGALRRPLRAEALLRAHAEQVVAVCVGAPAGLLWLVPAAWLAWSEMAPPGSLR